MSSLGASRPCAHTPVAVESGSGQGRVHGLVPVTGGAVSRCHRQAAQQGGSVGPAGGMEVGVLVEAGWVAGVRAVVAGCLQVSVVTLRAGRGGRCDAGLGTVGAKVGVPRRSMGLVAAVAAGTQLLCLDVRPQGLSG